MKNTPLSVQPEDTVQVRRSSLGSILFLILGFAAGLAVGYFNWGGASINATAETQAISPTAVDLQGTRRVDVPLGSAPILGSANAKVTIIEFSDYQCPYCQKWTREIWPQIQKAYPDQVRLVYKDFPLTSIHPDASPAALAARCANDQNKYWAFHDKLFAAKSLSTSSLELIAADLALDLPSWKACLTSNKYNTEIESDYTYGEQLGITGTPTFFINGLPMVGAQPFSAFKKVIDQELAAVQ